MMNCACTLLSSITGAGFHTVPGALGELWDMDVGSSAACWSLGRKLGGRQGDPRRRQGQARLWPWLGKPLARQGQGSQGHKRACLGVPRSPKVGVTTLSCLSSL